ncbi:hypothetical protein PIB30_086359, partial [Stylosanthes scabra]|nr:hypothetical protein [Stylosanthes scabra]
MSLEIYKKNYKKSDYLPLIEAIKGGDKIVGNRPHTPRYNADQKEPPLTRFTWALRESNRLAHTVANLKAAHHLPHNGVVQPPADLMNILRKEASTKNPLASTTELMESNSQEQECLLNKNVYYLGILTTPKFNNIPNGINEQCLAILFEDLERSFWDRLRHIHLVENIL